MANTPTSITVDIVPRIPEGILMARPRWNSVLPADVRVQWYADVEGPVAKPNDSRTARVLFIRAVKGAGHPDDPDAVLWHIEALDTAGHVHHVNDLPYPNPAAVWLTVST